MLLCFLVLAAYGFIDFEDRRDAQVLLLLSLSDIFYVNVAVILRRSCAALACNIPNLSLPGIFF